MQKKIELKNQWALAIYLLWENYSTGVTMVTAMKDWFHKFGSRLGEVEKGREDKLKISRLDVTTKNRFKHNCTYTRYKSNANKKYLWNLIQKLNNLGVKALHH